MALRMPPSASATSSTSQPVNVIKKAATAAAEVGLLNNECSTSVGTTTVLPEVAMPDKVTTNSNIGTFFQKSNSPY